LLRVCTVRSRSDEQYNISFTSAYQLRPFHPTARTRLPEELISKNLISTSTYAMEKINFTENSVLSEEILNTKLKGKLLLNFQTRSVTDFEHGEK